MTTTFIRFFDNKGNDMNLDSTASVLTSLYDGSISYYESFAGKIFFPKVSMGLIESQQIYLLQAVTGATSGPAAKFELRKIAGTAIVTYGSPYVTGINLDSSNLLVNDKVKIGENDYTVIATGATSFMVSPFSPISEVTENIYYYDYVNFSQLRTSIGTFNEKINVFVDDEYQTEFFLYDVDYADDVPIIARHFSSTYEMVDGSSDTIDPLTGRISLPNSIVLPTQINLGFSSGATATFEDIYEKPLQINFDKEFSAALISTPTGTTELTFIIGGTANPLYTISKLFLQGVTGLDSTIPFYEQSLKIISVGITGSNTFITTEFFTSPVTISNLSNYRIFWKNTETLATIALYGETESEDERFKLVLENFGKKIDFDTEYIFRDSDISEELPDYTLLNKKRKELLLEGDNIYPFMGSYKALVNIINFFGYYDLTIKEYFLNVDANSMNYNKYLHILVPRDDAQRKQVKNAWALVPSSVYRKTALFGLFYDINRATTEEDIYGIPVVEDAFDYSPEEVLIKLFGLKELLKRQFLPLNARIYDITGEGIYFERIKVDSWADNLNHLVLELGIKPQFAIYPEACTYLSDIRRIDQYYINKFTAQGLSGFVGSNAIDPYKNGLTGATGSSDPISNLYPDSLASYANYLPNPYTTTLDLELPIVDEIWLSMPPGIDNPDFNEISSRILPLPDDKGIIAGGPLLLESFFNITWEESAFTWLDLGILGPSASPINVNHWSWESLGMGEFIEMRWVIDKPGIQGFHYDSGRKNISDFAVATTGSSAIGTHRYLHAVALPYVGIYDIALYLYDITNGFSVDYQKYEVKSWNIDFVSIHKKETYERTWKDLEIPVLNDADTHTVQTHMLSWDEMTGPWYYPLHIKSTWEDAETSWESLNFSSYSGETLFEYSLNTSIVEINRELEYVVLQGDLTGSLNNVNNLNVGDYLFFNRQESDPIQSNFIINPGDFGAYLKGTDGISIYDTLVSGIIGDYVLSTDNDTTDYLKVGDQLLLGTNWYTVEYVSNIFITLSDPLIDNVYGYVKTYLSNSGVEISYSSPNIISIVPYTRSLITGISDYSLLDTSTDFYQYIDIISTTSTKIITFGNESLMKSLIAYNQAYTLYMTWGIFTGTYAIEITHITFDGNNTKFRLKDNIKELYYLDSNFSVRLADYDVDYAETKIGPNSVTYQNADQINWIENPLMTWSSLEFHGGTLCGFVIPFVSPGGSITIDENYSFIFSGNEFINSTREGLTVAAAELNSSTNLGINKYTYSVMPGDEVVETYDNVLYLRGSNNLPISLASPAAIGDGSILLNDIPVNLKFPNDPTFKEFDNYIWTGFEWLSIASRWNNFLLCSSIKYPLVAGTNFLLAYNYHKQLFAKPEIFQQFYFFIQAKAVNPSNEMLSYINFSNGVEGEWLAHPDRTYTYPLRNSFLRLADNDLILDQIDNNWVYQDLLYDKWVYEGSDYPPLSIQKEFSSDVLSYESRIPFAQTTQNSFSFIDTVIATQQETILPFTPVVFSYDRCRIPGKQNPVWSIKNENTNLLEVMSSDAKLMWNFSKTGNYTVSLKLEDTNGNVSNGQKISFIVV